MVTCQKSPVQCSCSLCPALRLAQVCLWATTPLLVGFSTFFVPSGRKSLSHSDFQGKFSLFKKLLSIILSLQSDFPEHLSLAASNLARYRVDRQFVPSCVKFLDLWHKCGENTIVCYGKTHAEISRHAFPLSLFWDLWQSFWLAKNSKSLWTTSCLCPRLRIICLQFGLTSLHPATTGNTAIISVYKPCYLARWKSPTLFFNSPVVSHQTCWSFYSSNTPKKAIYFPWLGLSLENEEGNAMPSRTKPCSEPGWCSAQQVHKYHCRDCTENQLLEGPCKIIHNFGSFVRTTCLLRLTSSSWRQYCEVSALPCTKLESQEAQFQP